LRESGLSGQDGHNCRLRTAYLVFTGRPLSLSSRNVSWGCEHPENFEIKRSVCLGWNPGQRTIMGRLAMKSLSGIVIAPVVVVLHGNLLSYSQLPPESAE
jgi:hypothetical protein